MNCDFAEEKILAALDAPLLEPDRRALAEHLAGCESCSNFREMQLAADRLLASKFAEIAAEASLADSIRGAAFEPAASPTPAWLPDALNAAGLALMVAVLGSLSWESADGTVLLLGVLGLVGIVCYPLLLIKTE